MSSLRRALVLLSFAPAVALADDGFGFDRWMAIISSIVVPILVAVLGHALGGARSAAQAAPSAPAAPAAEAKAPAKATRWLTQVGLAALPSASAQSPQQRRWLPWAVVAALLATAAGTGALTSWLLRRGEPVPGGTPMVGVAPVVMAPVVTAGMFVDRGQQFVRAGSEDGLAVGQSISVVGADKAALGQAQVVEVWEHLARVELDASAAGKAPSARFAALGVRAGAGPSDVALKGRASLSGVGPVKRLVVRNSGETAWSQCELRLPDNRRYLLSSLAAGTSDGVMLVKFSQDGVHRDVELRSVSVRCAQGAARFPLD